MRIHNLIKSLPFLTTLFITILISISNDNESTKLKFIIWNTPKLSVGRYIAISASTGFILSYFINTSLAKANEVNLKRSIDYKHDNKNVDSIFDPEINNDISYENTLIERSINDPSPTITASFRVIGSTNKNKVYPISNDINEELTNDYSYESDYQYTDQEGIDKDGDEMNLLSNDWEDDSYSNW